MWSKSTKYSKIKVVVVDDERDAAASVVKTMIRIFGEVVPFFNPTSALEYIKEHKVDLIVTDFVMPGMNGLELVTKIRNMESKITPVIVVSAQDCSKIFENHEMVATFVKPLDIDPFYLKIDQLLEQSKEEIVEHHYQYHYH